MQIANHEIFMSNDPAEWVGKRPFPQTKRIDPRRDVTRGAVGRSAGPFPRTKRIDPRRDVTRGIRERSGQGSGSYLERGEEVPVRLPFSRSHLIRVGPPLPHSVAPDSLRRPDPGPDRGPHCRSAQGHVPGVRRIAARSPAATTGPVMVSFTPSPSISIRGRFVAIVWPDFFALTTWVT